VIDVHDAGGEASEILVRAGQLSTTTPVVLLGNETQLLVPKPIDAEPLRQLCRRLVGADGDKPRVLVIDDDPRVAGLVAAALGPGYGVEAALTASDGLRRARGERFQLHVVDLTLPDGSGFDILETLAGEEATRAIPRVVLTAAQLDKAQLEQLRRHAQAVAPKGSVTPAELLGVVDRLVRPPAAVETGDARPTGLVVDDHDMNRDLARSILERLGYGVVQARDGAEAVAVAERVVPALILMDLAMPGTDGFTATRQLKANPKLRRIPVVALSALAMKADEDKARAAGVDAFLTKPVDRLSLERTVARLLAD
jgi:CheY-like chemotaxis protein